MANWGYTVSKDNQIDFDKGNQDVYTRVIAQEPSVLSCIACGSCASVCSAANFSEGVNVRKLNILVSRGQLQGLDAQLNKCMLCGKCILVCPRGVNTRNFVRILKEIIFETGKNTAQ